jgi:hypothetical protein
LVLELAMNGLDNRNGLMNKAREWARIEYDWGSR